MRWNELTEPEPTPAGWWRFVARWMALSLVLHLVTAYFSVGYHSADEYFQILEFLSYKLGWTPAHDLAVEFREQMRPWMQPFLYGLMAKGLAAQGVTSPFSWAFAFRLASGLVGWLSVVALATRARVWFPSESTRHYCVMALALIWFFPALHVRPSSESLGGSVFLIAVALVDWLARLPRAPKPEPETVPDAAEPSLGDAPTVLTDSSAQSAAEASAEITSTFELEPPPPRFSRLQTLGRACLWLAAGALLGLSFEFRFQMGIAVAGLVLWIVLVARVRGPALIGLALGIAAMLVAGRAVDRWGYGEWVISPWRYVDYNLLRGEVNRFGQAPVWDVFRMSFTESWPFIGLALAIATLVAWAKNLFHPLTWALLPFFLVHEAIAHKELRFFFPIAMAGPALLTQAWVSNTSGRLLDPDDPRAWPAWLRGVARWVSAFLLVNNLVALAVLTFVPFSRTAQFYEGVARAIPAGAERFEILYLDRDPYTILGNPVYFYRPPGLVTTRIGSYDELANRMSAQPGESHWLFHPQFRLPQEAASLSPRCEPVFRTLPEWLERVEFVGAGNWLERVNVWTLFRCSGAG